MLPTWRTPPATSFGMRHAAKTAFPVTPSIRSASHVAFPLVADIIEECRGAAQSRRRRVGPKRVPSRNALALLDEALVAIPRIRSCGSPAPRRCSAGVVSSKRARCCVAVEQSGLRTGALYLKLGWACFWLARVDDAAEFMRKAVSLHQTIGPRFSDWRPRCARRSAPSESRLAFERVLQMKPGDRHCISNLVACEVELDHPDIAERYARSALERDPDSRPR